jgi:AI-2 transport protein TqsA
VSNRSRNLGISTEWGINLLAGAVVVVALYFGRALFIPLVIAVLMASITWPVADWLNRCLHFSWAFACLVVVAAFVALTLLVTTELALIVPRVWQAGGPDNVRSAKDWEQVYTEVRDRVGKIYPLANDDQLFPARPSESRVFGYVQKTLAEGPVLTNSLWMVGEYVNDWVWHWVLVTFILIFLLIEAEMLGQRLVEVFEVSGVTQQQAVEVISATASAVRKYLVWRTLINVVIGLALAVAYHWLFHLKFPWTWGLLTIVAWYVPYLGPVFAGFPPFVDSFMVSPSPWYAIGLLIFYSTVVTLEGYVIVPVVMGRRVELNATTVMLACLFWDLVWGLPGLFLAVPLMAALRALCEIVPGWRPWANLMSTKIHDPPRARA